MGKKKIDAKTALVDIRSGMPDDELMSKYGISSSGLQSLFHKLMRAGLITQRELDDRFPLSDRTVTVSLYKCPGCGLPQFEAFDECPQCGIIVAKVRPDGWDSIVEEIPAPNEQDRTEELTPEPPAPTEPEQEEPHIPSLELEKAVESLSKAVLAAAKGETDREENGPKVPIGFVDSGPTVTPVTRRRTGAEVTAPLTSLKGVKWKFETAGQVFSSPAICEGVVCFGSWDGNLYAVELETGEEKWRFKTQGSIYATPAIAYGSVYVGSLDGNFYVVDLASGREERRFEVGAPIYSSARVAGGLVYFGTYDGVFYALDTSTGEPTWTFETHKAIRSSACISDNVILFGCNDGFLYALE
jgi:hypothetical protein